MNRALTLDKHTDIDKKHALALALQSILELDQYTMPLREHTDMYWSNLSTLQSIEYNFSLVHGARQARVDNVIDQIWGTK